MTKNLFRLALALAFAAASSAHALAQNENAASASPAQPAPAQAATRTTADETFELNITERRITEREFEASTAVEAGEETARGLRLRVGVSVGADEINVLLRNVRGRVSFRATLARVLDRLTTRRAPAAAP
ncbi:MAG TPA: hypothetical protein VN256_04475 [Pyrinomonadaceae bacterium]|nr:hypothetical protein [Pyrinomonadaceae bacterium]